MKRALKQIQELIDCYDYWCRDCHPYFQEPEEKYKERKNELVETLNELRQSYKILNEVTVERSEIEP